MPKKVFHKSLLFINLKKFIRFSIIKWKNKSHLMIVIIFINQIVSVFLKLTNELVFLFTTTNVKGYYHFFLFIGYMINIYHFNTMIEV